MHSSFFRELQLITVLLKHTVCLSKTMRGIFHFSVRFVLSNLLFWCNKKHGLFYWNVKIPFKIKMTEKPHALDKDL